MFVEENGDLYLRKWGGWGSTRASRFLQSFRHRRDVLMIFNVWMKMMIVMELCTQSMSHMTLKLTSFFSAIW